MGADTERMGGGRDASPFSGSFGRKPGWRRSVAAASVVPLTTEYVFEPPPGFASILAGGSDNCLWGLWTGGIRNMQREDADNHAAGSGWV